MKKHNTPLESKQVPPPTWETLEEAIRLKVQCWIQDVLEEEVTEFLGRSKSERRQAVDETIGYRNGHGKPRQLTLGSGTISIHRPRVRNLENRFESRVLPFFAKRTPAIAEVLPELYLHGLAEGDFDLALRGLLGDDAPLSASTIARLKQKWQSELEAWQTRRLDNLEVVYLWTDGVYIKAGLEKDKSALLVVIAGLRDGRKVLLTVQSGHRESTESWSQLLRDLKQRGLRPPKLVMGDGALGLWGGLRNVFPEAKEQRCWNHRIMNLVDRISKRHQKSATMLLRKVAYAETRAAALNEKEAFQRWCRQHSYTDAARLIDDDWERMVTFYDFPKEHWQHLRTTNPVESPFAALRLRTDAAKRFKKVENATAVVWKMLLIAERRFRRLNAPDLLDEVWMGVEYRDGIKVESKCNELAAAA